MDATPSIFHPVIGDRVHVANAAAAAELMREHPDWHFFSESRLVYVPFCADFGPFNLADVHQFVQIMHQKLEQCPNQTIVYCVEGQAKEMSNAVFLLGCYMIMAMGLSPESVQSCFESIIPLLPAYRDAAYGPCDFDLSLLDCWRGLHRALKLGWIAEYDMAEYMHYDNVLEGDLHAIIPGKLFAFKGPQSLEGPSSYQDRNGRRTFAPRFYLDPFADMEVSTVVRLNEREYADAEFEAHGIRCVGLEFEGCTPTPDVVIAFLHTVRSARGAVAVHCKAGLGRTGTLAALYLMQAHGFTAREAIAWVRIVRPGSIIGDQQHFLASIDAAQTMSLLTTPPPSPPPPPTAAASAVGTLAAAPVITAHGVDVQRAEADNEQQCAPAPPPAAAAAAPTVGSAPDLLVARRAAFERAVFRTLRSRRRLSAECAYGGRNRFQSSY